MIPPPFEKLPAAFAFPDFALSIAVILSVLPK
jgi:hypothetical protein